MEETSGVILEAEAFDRINSDIEGGHRPAPAVFPFGDAGNHLDRGTIFSRRDELTGSSAKRWIRSVRAAVRSPIGPIS